MDLSNLVKTTDRSKKRIGRGAGSGKGGHTVGRGQKGQKTRGKIGLIFQGSKMRKTLIKRLPLLRGKGKFRSFKPRPIIINLKYLNLFKENEVVNLETLVKRGLIREEDRCLGVKILGEGEISVPLTVQLPVSKGAKVKIEKVGGGVEKPGTPKALKSHPKERKEEKLSPKRTKVNQNEKGS